MPKEYFILFFVIDGDTFDDEGTCRAIVRASALPISVVLIGVGDFEFPNLRKYDADTSPLSSPEGITSVRDAVQFVCYEDYRSKNGVMQRAELAADLLRELPYQLESYMALYGVNLPTANAEAGGEEKLPKGGSAPVSAAVGEKAPLSIQLKFRCNGLTPFAECSFNVKVRVEKRDRYDSDGAWVEIGATDNVQDAADPLFTTPVNVEFVFERKQHLRFRVCEDHVGTIRDYGSAEILLAQIVATRRHFGA